ncbi:FAD-dependent monooxygenase [Wenjunlia tyrosinilytica]|uniref:Monooxygenase n=1 Tax=Wenjunlia tyrosinilytica TaxID=1544741 RepID=A0A918DZY7_9ACTN|nr:FAD-dependent monooxygenase [Wenjunlia tyrosinilytica]GGO91523.1 monooxygenase [Wenjunlia tyrosinilytica]
MDPVIVVGGGPVGLALALALARQDVPSVVIEQGEGRPRENPRTVVLRPDTAALLTRLGYKSACSDGASWTVWRTMRRRRELLRVEFGGGDRFGDHEGIAPGPRPADGARPTGPRPAAGYRPAAGQDDGYADGVMGRQPSPLHLRQNLLLRGLADAAAASGLIQLATGSHVDAVEQDDDGVTVHTRGDATTWWRGSHLVGCDGTRSIVRKLLGVRFPGRTAVDRYAVATVRAELPFPGEALLHWEPPWRGDSEVTARPLPDGVWRVDWRLPPVSSTAAMASHGDLLTPDALITKIRDTLAGWCGSVPRYDLLASAEYGVHQRLAQRWRVGRAFLAGDAAHQLGALGVQSVDEGLRDVDNLAWKLAAAWHRHASDTLLDSYQAERRGAVGARLRAADQALPLLRSSGALRSARRSLLSGPARKHGSLLSDGNVGTGLLGGPSVYRRSRLSAPSSSATTDTPVGGQVDDVPVTALDGSRTRLRERLGRDLLVVLVAPGTGVWDSRHWLSAGLMPALSAATAALPVPAELLVAETYPGSTAHTVLLVRPDGHLAAVMNGFRPAELHASAELARGGSPEAEAETEAEQSQDRVGTG